MIWSVKTGSSLGVFSEKEPLLISLPLDKEDAEVILISGNLPPGIVLHDNILQGSPFEVSRTTTFKFVIRASYEDTIEDITLSMSIVGADAPLWITNEGTLSIGPNNIHFILDSHPVDFQLRALDEDLPAGDNLTYFIASGNGVLPPGIHLTQDGRLVGIIDPVLSLDKDAGGEYETQPYDTSFYDFAVKSFNGYSSFYYDTEFYDYSIPTKVPKKLNRYYQFTVTVTDGETPVDRVFQIYVVGDDFLRADNTIMQIANGLFTADNTNIRTPIWVTPGDLGYRRANNYVSILLDVIDNNTLQGAISYVLLDTNPDGSISQLPEGMSLENADGEIAGRVPYQPAITREYTFTIRAQRVTPGEEYAFKDKTFSLKLLGEIESVITWKSPTVLGLIPANNTSLFKVEAETSIQDAKVYYELVDGRLPPGLSLSISGEIIGKVNQFAREDLPGLTTFDNNNTIFDNNRTTIDKEYEFTIKAKDQLGYSAIEKTFLIKVDDPDDKLYSNVFIKPFLKENQRNQFFDFINNANIFPLNNIYRPNDPNFGIQKNLKILLYAGIETKKLETYVAATAKHHKRKKFKFGDLKVAQAKLPGSNEILYEVIYIDIIDPAYNGKVPAKTIDTTHNKITVDSVEYAPFDEDADSLSGDSFFYVYTKKYGPVQVNGNGITIPVGTTQDQNQNATLPNVDFNIEDVKPFRFRPQNTTLKADSNTIKISDISKSKKYISNIYYMRSQLRDVGETERDFLPLWMKTSQVGSIQELGYISCMVLAYCKPNQSEEIFFNIKNSDFDFKNLNLDIDRYIIDSIEGNSQETYILFPKSIMNI